MAFTPEISSLIASVADESGLARRYPGFMERMAQIESSGNPGAKNASGAAGLYQFMPQTARSYGLSDPFDPAASARAAARLTMDNAAQLTKALGREPTAGQLYLAHQQGGGGASKLLANPDARAADIVGSKAVLGNGGSLNDTAAEFANRWVSKFDGSGPTMTMPSAAGPQARSGRFGVSGVEPSAAPAPTMTMPSEAPSEGGGLDAARLMQLVLAQAQPTQKAPEPPAPSAPAPQAAPPPQAEFDAARFYALLGLPPPR